VAARSLCNTLLWINVSFPALVFYRQVIQRMHISSRLDRSIEEKQRCAVGRKQQDTQKATWTISLQSHFRLCVTGRGSWSQQRW
jgi:hypothetical protein